MLHSSKLGATLYVPATRDDLVAIAAGTKYPDLRSVVFDVEDAVLERDTGLAIANLGSLFGRLQLTQNHDGGRPLIFVRPRNPEVHARILGLKGVEAVDGFVIPKATADVLPEYVRLLQNRRHCIMPTIETRDAFDHHEMVRLREQLLTIRDRVLAIRIGGNDLLHTLGCRRSTKRTAYSGPLGSIIASLVTTFVPWGFQMSAPVLENFSDRELLQDEIERDIEHGLWTKTAIHPDQVTMIHEAYRVDDSDYKNALSILSETASAVFAVGGVMSEPATHRAWAQGMVARAQTFGIRHSAPAALALVG